MSHSVRLSLSKDKIKEIYLGNLQNGGLFIETSKFYGLGDSVELELNILELNSFMKIKGKVAWHRRPRAWSSSLPSGIGFEFDEEEDSKKDFLLNWSKGLKEDKRDGNMRHRVTCPVKIKIQNSWIPAESRDISPGGMLISTGYELEEGNNLQCLIYTDDSPRPVECNIIVNRVEKTENGYLIGTIFQRTTPLIRRTFSQTPSDIPAARQTNRVLNAKINRRVTKSIAPPRVVKHTIPFIKNS